MTVLLIIAETLLPLTGPVAALKLSKCISSLCLYQGGVWKMSKAFHVAVHMLCSRPLFVSAQTHGRGLQPRGVSVSLCLCASPNQE